MAARVTAAVAVVVAGSALGLDLWSRAATISAVPAFMAFHLTVGAGLVLGVSLAVGAGAAYRTVASTWRPATALVLLVGIVARREQVATTSPSPRSLVLVLALVVALLVYDLVRAWPWSDRPVREPFVACWTATLSLGVLFGAFGPADRGAVRVGWIEVRVAAVGLVAGALVAVVAGFGRRGRRAVVRWLLVAAGGVLAFVSAADAAARTGPVHRGTALAGVGLALLGLLTYRTSLVDAALAAGRSTRQAAAAWVRCHRPHRAAAHGVRRAGAAVGRAWAALLRISSPSASVPRRHLDRRDRWAAAAMAVLSTGYVASGVLWADRVGWQPTAHAATLMARSHDVGTRDHPLTGMMTSLGSLGDVKHPGPMLFDLMAPFVRVLGVRHGAYAGAATIALVCWAVAVWAAWRVAGRSAAVLAWIAGAAVLAIPTLGAVWEMNNVSPTFLAMFAVLVASWAAASGVARAWWWSVALGSLCAQAYLPHGMIVIGIVTWSGLAVAGWARRTPDPDEARSVRRALRIGWAIGLVCWLQPLIDMVLHQGGNVRAIAENVAAPRPPVGPVGFPRAVAWIFSVPPRWGLLTGSVAEAGTAQDFLGGPAVVGGLVAVGVAVWWVRSWSSAGVVRRRLRVGAVLVMVAAGVNTTQLPQEELRAFDVEWLVVCSIIVWFAVVVDLVLAWEVALARDHASALRPLRTAGFALGVVAVLAASLSGPRRIEDIKSREFTTDAIVDPLVHDVLASSGHLRGRPVLVLGMDSRLIEVAADTLSSNLMVRGMDLRFEPGPGIQYGARRIVDGPWDGPSLWVVSGLPPTKPQGRRLARAEVPGWSQARTDRLALEIARWARAHGPLRLDAQARSTMARYLAGWVDGDPCRQAADLLAGRARVEDLPPGLLLTLVADQMIASPAVPPSMTTEAAVAVGQAPVEVWEVDAAPGPARADLMRRDGTRCAPVADPP